MRTALILLLLSALIWGGLPLVHSAVNGKGAAAFADSGSSGSSDDDSSDDDSDDDDDDDDSSGSGSGSSGSGSSGSGSSGSGSSGSGSSGSGNSGSGNSGSGSAGGAARSTGGDALSAVTASAREPFGRDGIAIRFSDGHVERVRDGRYETIDPRGRVVESHAAALGDRARLEALGNRVKRRDGATEIETVVEIADRGTAIEVTDYRGWREIVTRGAYIVKDPKGRTVARRPVTVDDIIRLRDSLALD